MVKKEEIIEKIENKEEQEVKSNKKEDKKSKKSKKSKDPVEDLDEILYGKQEKEQIDLGEEPKFISLGKNKKSNKEEIPDYLKY